MTMYTHSSFQSEGLRWIAGVLTDLADFIDRMDSAPGGSTALTASEAVDDNRARILARYY